VGAAWPIGVGADTFPPPNPAPRHSSSIGADPKPVGVSCGEDRLICKPGTPNAGKVCSVDADCGAAPPGVNDCSFLTVGTCGSLVQRGQKCAAEGEGCFLLSNAHVLGLLDPGDGHVQARRGDVVSLPSRIDGGPPPNDAQPIGEFWEARRIKFGPADENVRPAPGWRAPSESASPARFRTSASPSA
jgi:hypothetical protein